MINNYNDFVEKLKNENHIRMIWGGQGNAMFTPELVDGLPVDHHEHEFPYPEDVKIGHIERLWALGFLESVKWFACFSFKKKDREHKRFCFDICVKALCRMETKPNPYGGPRLVVQ